MTTQDSLWISWEDHRRTESLVRELGVPLEIMLSRQSRWLKHPTFVVKTIHLLFQRRPRVLYVQNPSWLLTMLAIFLRPLLRYTLVVDAHNGGVYPFFGWMERFPWIFPIFHRHSDVTIVTNESLAETVTANGGTPVVLPDALPDWDIATAPSGAEKSIAFICTFADDEPVAEVVKAAHGLPAGYRLSITGKVANCPPDILKSAAPNTTCTDFLSEEDFHTLLATSDVIMDLTTFDDCLVCGAYESVSLGVPLVLSDSPVNREYFDSGVVYAENEADALCRAMVNAVENNVELRTDILDLRCRLQESWRARLTGLLTLVDVN